ncbi:hypothetical protein ABH978_004042 [Bradyrhizobium ottawaense]
MARMVHRRHGRRRRRCAGQAGAHLPGPGEHDKSWFAEERFYGCPFINAVGEHDKDAKQFRNIALKHKKIVLGHIEKLAGELGSSEPAVLAHQLGLLIDGAIVAAMISRDPGVADTAALTAGPLLGQSKSKKKRAADQLEAV